MLIALSLTMMLVVTVLPIYQLLQTERVILNNRLMIQSKLHDLLLDKLYKREGTSEDKLIINHLQIPVIFQTNNGIVKGCAQWTNEKGRDEKLCLYGIPE